MAWQWFVDWLTGNMVLVDVPSPGVAPSGDGTFLFIDGTNFNFVDGTGFNFIS